MNARSLATCLLDHAARAMPKAQREWVEAMRAELNHIEGDGSAAAFAFGCVQASYARRLRDAGTLAGVARWTITGLALAWAGISAAWAALMIKIKASEGVTPADLGADPGTADTLRFIEAYPNWQLGLIAVFVVLLAAGAVQLFRRRRSAFPLLVLGVAAAVILALIDANLFDPAANRLMVLDIRMMILAAGLIPAWWLSHRATG